MPHHSSTLTQLITSSSLKKMIKTFFLHQNIRFYGCQLSWVEGKRMVKLLEHAHRHMPMRMGRDAMLPFVEKASDERPEN